MKHRTVATTDYIPIYKLSSNRSYEVTREILGIPIDLGLWRIENNDTFRRVSSTNLDQQERLEEFLLQDPNVLTQPLLVVDREITTPSGKRLDILVIGEDDDLHVGELKRGSFTDYFWRIIRTVKWKYGTFVGSRPW